MKTVSSKKNSLITILKQLQLHNHFSHYQVFIKISTNFSKSVHIKITIFVSNQFLTLLILLRKLRDRVQFFRYFFFSGKSMPAIFYHWFLTACSYILALYNKNKILCL